MKQTDWDKVLQNSGLPEEKERIQMQMDLERGIVQTYAKSKGLLYDAAERQLAQEGEVLASPFLKLELKESRGGFYRANHEGAAFTHDASLRYIDEALNPMLKEVIAAFDKFHPRHLSITLNDLSPGAFVRWTSSEDYEGYQAQKLIFEFERERYKIVSIGFGQDYKEVPGFMMGMRETEPYFSIGFTFGYKTPEDIAHFAALRSK